MICSSYGSFRKFILLMGKKYLQMVFLFFVFADKYCFQIDIDLLVILLTLTCKEKIDGF